MSELKSIIVKKNEELQTTKNEIISCKQLMTINLEEWQNDEVNDFFTSGITKQVKKRHSMELSCIRDRTDSDSSQQMKKITAKAKEYKMERDNYVAQIEVLKKEIRNLNELPNK